MVHVDNCTHNTSAPQLTHESSKVQRSLIPLVHGLGVASLHKQEGDHFQVAIVGSMVEGSLTGAITDVKVTKVRDQGLCVCVLCCVVCVCVCFKMLRMCTVKKLPGHPQ